MNRQLHRNAFSETKNRGGADFTGIALTVNYVFSRQREF
jgi:hypothetical protein